MQSPQNRQPDNKLSRKSKQRQDDQNAAEATAAREPDVIDKSTFGGAASDIPLVPNESADDTQTLEGESEATEAELGLLKELDKLSEQNTSLQNRLEEQTRLIAEKEDQLLRALADIQNTQKRMQDQVTKSRDYAIETFAKDLLAVADSLEKATQSTQISNSSGLQQHLEGMKMTLELLWDVLHKHGVVRVAAEIGQPFDHQLHLAMATIINNDMPPNAIVEVFQPGYSIHSRLLRAAMVSVAKKAE